MDASLTPAEKGHAEGGGKRGRAKSEATTPTFSNGTEGPQDRAPSRVWVFLGGALADQCSANTYGKNTKVGVDPEPGRIFSFSAAV